MNNLARIFGAGLLLSAVSQVAHGADGTWIANSSSTWSTTGNWAGGIIADGVGAVGDFTTVNLSASRIVTIDTTSRTLGILNLGDTNGTHNYTIAASGGASLIFDNGGLNAQLNNISTSGTNTISAPILLNSSLAINNASANNLHLSGIVSGTGGITKSGPGTVTLSGNNSFSGGVAILEGGLAGGNNANAFGASTNLITLGASSGTASASLSAASTLTYAQAIDVAAGSTGTLSINSTSNSSTVTFGGAITLHNNLTFAALGSGGIVASSGGISGTGNIIAANLSGGSTTISNSVNNVGSITNESAGTGGLSLSAVIGSNVTEVVQNSATSQLTISGNNTSFAGGVTVKSGTASATTSGNALGTGTVKLGDTSGSANATLLGGSFTYANAITVQAGSSGIATLGNGGSAAIFSGLVTLNKDLVIASLGTGSVRLSGAATGAALTGTGNIIVTAVTPAATNVTIGGTNTGFTGNVTINGGTLKLDTGGGANSGAFALNSANAVAVDSLSGATFDLNNNSPTIAGLNNGANGGGLVTNTAVAARTLTLGGSGTYTFSGVITGSGAGTNMSLTVAMGANGRQILTGANTYAGATTITAGTLIINGDNSGATGTVSVNGGVLSGTGTIGGATTIANNATLAPGASPGVLTFSNNLTFGGVDSQSNFEIATGTRGTNYDGVNVGGLLTYNGDLTLTMTGLIADGTYNLFDFTSEAGSLDTIAFGGGGNPYSGSFVNNAGVWTTTSGGQTFTFTQSTGDLVVAAVPEPSILALAAAGGMLLVTLRRRRAGAR